MTEDSKSNPPVSPVSLGRLLVPVVAFILMILWSNIPPYRAHIEHEKRALFVWHWHLYIQGGRGACEVRYFNMNEGGAPIERWKLYGYERPSQMPDNLARVRSESLYGDHKHVCQELQKAGDPKPNVEALSRCGVGSGWERVDERAENVCTAKRKPAKLRKSKTTGPAR